MIYIISHQIILFGEYLACLSNFMCILAKNVCNYVTVCTEIYMCLYTYVYSACNREVVGSSATRGELFSKKSSAVESGRCFPCVVSISHVNL